MKQFQDILTLTELAELMGMGESLPPPIPVKPNKKRNAKKKAEKLARRKKRMIKGWEHRSWGNKINWINWEARRLYGLVPFNPEVGDYYQDKMKSGKIALFQIVKVERPGNPRDMFFATVKDVGFLDEVQP